MRKFFIVFLSLFCFVANAQITSLPTREVIDNNAANKWQILVSYPDNFYATTDSTSLFVFMPGVGETGDTPGFLTIYGFHKSSVGLGTTWNGGVELGNGVHYPVYVTVVPINNTYPTPSQYDEILQVLLTRYRVKVNSWFLMGFSRGGNASDRYASWLEYNNAGRKYKRVTAVHTTRGAATDSLSQKDGLPVGPMQRMQNYVQQGGKVLNLTQTADFAAANSVKVAAMNSVMPGSVIFYWTQFTGTHPHTAGVNSPFEPSFNNFNYIGPIKATNANYHPSIPASNPNQNIYQMLLRMGDTTLVSVDTAKFTFSATSQSVAGWVNVSGHPHLGVRTGTDKGITISTRSTGVWIPIDNSTASSSGGETVANPTFSEDPDLYKGYLFSKQTAIADGNEHLEVSGLVPDANYTIEVCGSRSAAALSAMPSRNVFWIVKDKNGRRLSRAVDIKGNTTQSVILNVQADGSGKIYIGSYGAHEHGSSTYGFYNWMKIIRQTLPGTANFNFSLTSQSIDGWEDITGEPHQGITTGYQNGITISTRSTGLWTPIDGKTASASGGETVANPTFSENPDLYKGYFFSKQTAVVDGNEHLEVSGLVPDANYTIEVCGSRSAAALSAMPSRYVFWVVKDKNGRQTSTAIDIKGNTIQSAILNVQANSSGKIYIGSYGAHEHGSSTYGYFNWLKVTQGSGASLRKRQDQPFAATLINNHSSKVFMYPNPVSNELYLKDGTGNPVMVKSYSIYNSTGKLVLRGTNRSAIAVNALEGGLYVLQLHTEEGMITERFIKQ